MSSSPLRRVVIVAAASACALTGLVAVAPPARAAVTDLVINEFYGRGGSANQPYTHKFVELFNSADAAVDLAGTSLHYRSATGVGSASGVAALSGTVPAGGYFLIQLGSNGSTGAGLPTPDLVASVNPSGTTGTVFLARAITAVSPDAAETVIDKLGYGASNSPETTPAPYPGSNSTPGSLQRRGGADTDDNAADFAFSSDVTPQNSTASGPAPSPSPTPTPTPTPTPADVTPIAAIQGPGDATPLAGQRVVTEGVVTATYPSGGFGGIYIQTAGTGGAARTPGQASDGVFVYSSWAASNTAIGDCVRVEGTAAEYNGLTQLAGNPFVTVTTGCAPVTATPLATLPASDAEKEPYEGMLVLPQGPYTITNNYALNQYGQAGLAVGTDPLLQATDVVPWQQAAAYEAANLAKYITLDDGSSWNYLTNTTAKNSPLPYLSAATPMRTASQVTFTQPVILDHRFQWNYQPTGQIVGADGPLIPITRENDRPAEAPNVGGAVQIGFFNVLNYFTDLGQDEAGCRAYTDRENNPVTTNNCQVRGAYTPEAFADQKAKLVAAINGLGAEVVALSEIENSAGLSYIDHPRDAALADLVAGLNAAAGTERWAYVPSPTVVPSNEDVIRTAFIYDRTQVQLLGPSYIDVHEAFANARYPLAQKFKVIGSGKPFVVVANHFKSKGSGEDDGTGQGLSNPSRVAQARQLVDWTRDMFRGEAVFLVGDFNAYSAETPIELIENAGYLNLAGRFDPSGTSYQFSGRLGSLDHAFANGAARRLVTGAAIWDINGDESVAFQYSRRNYNVVDLHAPDPYASSDHDPVLVGVNTGPRGRG
ncbi:ExeM/NucH family extracellular endonuclease [Propioniciclava soli]|uniref:ExeM/NucH family extracellular endonuclease n=1 Tax=Propioniciclava soli TaxID=2775081 RepID=A0ABZ3C7T2_9ACTN